MKKVRIGNDIHVEWTILKGGEPYEGLEHESPRLLLTAGCEAMEATGWTIEDNVVKWTFWGKDQKSCCVYGLTLLLNSGEEGMRAVDACKIVQLVPRSCMTGGETEGNVVVETIEVSGDINLPSDGLSAYEIAVRHGYAGTEAEWLEYLREPALTAAATANEAAERADAATAASEAATASAQEATTAADKATAAAVEATAKAVEATTAAVEATGAADAATAAAKEATAAAKDITGLYILTDAGLINMGVGIVEVSTSGGVTLTKTDAIPENWSYIRGVNSGERSEPRTFRLITPFKPSELDSAFRNNVTIESADLGLLDCSEITSLFYSFYGCSSLTSLTLPSDLSRVKDMSFAFDGCSSLTSLTLPGLGVAYNLRFAFHNCTSLESVTMPVGMAALKDMTSAFYGCSSLTSLKMPEYIPPLSNLSYAFYGCSSLRSLKMPRSLLHVTLWTSAFHNCTALTDLTMPDFIGTSAVVLTDMFTGATSLSHVTCSQMVKDWIEAHLNDTGGQKNGMTRSQFDSIEWTITDETTTTE